VDSKSSVGGLGDAPIDAQPGAHGVGQGREAPTEEGSLDARHRSGRMTESERRSVVLRRRRVQNTPLAARRMGNRSCGGVVWARAAPPALGRDRLNERVQQRR
jgi:hypothetical protein